MPLFKEYKYSYIWIILGLCTLLMNEILAEQSAWVEYYYFRGPYQWMRCIYDYTIGRLPLPIVYIVNVVFIVYNAHIITSAIRLYQSGRRKKALLNFILKISGVVGGAIFLFYFLWGFNYHRASIYDQLDMPVVTVDSVYLMTEADRITQELIQLRAQLSTDTIAAIDVSYIPEDMESEIRHQVERLLSEWGQPVMGRVRIRKLRPSGLLLRFSTAGVYIPYAMEGHIDAGLHPIQWPFTMAHEMAHGYGVGDEGTCNFIGYLACIRSDNLMIRYSGVRGYWRYLMSDIRRLDREIYNKRMRSLPKAVKTDIKDIISYMDRYPDLMPVIRNKVYDQYLKSHGVKGGLANYSHMIRYIRSYNQRLTDN